ncbi:MAG: ABC transporter ATP-binding protein [Planctomycetota bacterium]
MTEPPVVLTRNLTKTYGKGGGQVRALDCVNISVRRGEFVSIMGQSGSGKSTLLHLIGCLQSPSSGDYILDGEAVAGLDDEALSDLRNRKIGFIFQKFNLLNQQDIVTNVALPLVYAGVSKHERIERAVETLKKVGLGDRLTHRPTELSGGQDQRVAIARALVTDPAILLADEPTGNLDTKTGEEIMTLFAKLQADGRTIIQVTHDESKALLGDRTIRLRDGKVIDDGLGGVTL